MGVRRDLPITRLTPGWREYGKPKLPQIIIIIINWEFPLYILKQPVINAPAEGRPGVARFF